MVSIDSTAPVSLLSRGHDGNWKTSGGWCELPEWMSLTIFPPMFSKVAEICVILDGNYSDFLFPKSDIENFGAH